MGTLYLGEGRTDSATRSALYNRGRDHFCACSTRLEQTCHLLMVKQCGIMRSRIKLLRKTAGKQSAHTAMSKRLRMARHSMRKNNRVTNTLYTFSISTFHRYMESKKKRCNTS